MEIIYYLLSFVFGLLIGSFLNVVLWRTRENLSIVLARSICPECRHQLAWYDNIPLVSFLFLLGGHCRYCQQKISWQYPLVEFVTGILFVLVAWQYHGREIFVTPEMVASWLITSFLIFIFVYDWKYQEILDRVTLLPAVLVYLFAVSMQWHAWYDLLLAGFIGGGFFAVQYIFSKGRWIGGGDIRLGIFMGIILGWPKIILALGLAYVAGAILSLVIISFDKNKSLKSEVPFGTYLAAATFFTMLWGDEILRWYLGLLQ